LNQKCNKLDTFTVQGTKINKQGLKFWTCFQLGPLKIEILVNFSGDRVITCQYFSEATKVKLVLVLRGFSISWSPRRSLPAELGHFYGPSKRIVF
jgi:hypothetical protein